MSFPGHGTEDQEAAYAGAHHFPAPLAAAVQVEMTL